MLVKIWMWIPRGLKPARIHTWENFTMLLICCLSAHNSTHKLSRGVLFNFPEIKIPLPGFQYDCRNIVFTSREIGRFNQRFDLLLRTALPRQYPCDFSRRNHII